MTFLLPDEALIRVYRGDLGLQYARLVRPRPARGGHEGWVVLSMPSTGSQIGDLVLRLHDPHCPKVTAHRVRAWGTGLPEAIAAGAGTLDLGITIEWPGRPVEGGR